MSTVVESIHKKPKSGPRSERITKYLRPGPQYSPGVRIGNWVQDMIECPKGGTLYFPPKEEIDYEKMKVESRSTDFRRNRLASYQGIGMSTVIQHDSHVKCGNYTTTNDLVYNHFPKPLCGPIQRHYKRGKHQWYPQPDLTECYVPERIELDSQLSKIANMEQNGEAVKPPDKLSSKKTDMRRTVLNMEVETLRWQLAQTEANRQMHIALLKQIVAFLNRVKDHIENNENNCRKDSPSRLLPRSFNVADLPRSRSVVHVNKNIDYSLTTPKKMTTRKISKSITSMNGFKDCNSAWNQSKLSLTPQSENSQKISEEMSRLITLANTVLSTKIPDLACSCNDKNGDSVLSQDKTIIEIAACTDQGSTSILNQIEKNVSKFDDPFENDTEIITKSHIVNFSHTKHETFNNLNGYPDIKLLENQANKQSLKQRSDLTSMKNAEERKNDFNSSFIEDESGFSSMSSFQEIGIPIISIIPPSPCKEIGFMEDLPDLLDDGEKWKTDTMELEKQTVKVFWV